MGSSKPVVVQNGAAIKALREANGWRSGKFATHLTISTPYLSNIEAGRKNCPPDLLVQIARALGCPLAAIKRDGMPLDEAA